MTGSLANPYRLAQDDGTYRWYFRDETGDPYGPYPSEARAKKELEAYCRFLDHGPTRWQRIWWPTRSTLKRAWKWMTS